MGNDIKIIKAISKLQQQIKDIIKSKPKDGLDGKDGYTPVKGKDYFDGKDGKNGYTPVKGKDYFDGRDGLNGKDGYTPIKGKDYFDGKDGLNGQDGSDGKDGVGIKDLTINKKGHLIVTLTNGKKIDCGKCKGEQGERGLAISGGRGSDGKDGIGIVKVEIVNNHLIVSLTNGETIDAGEVSGSIPEDVLTQDSILQTIEECEQCQGKQVPSGKLLAQTFNKVLQVEEEIPTDYVTEGWVEQQGYLTEHQPLKTLGGESLVGTGDIPLPTGEEYTFNEEHNIREINSDVQVFTDNGDVINDNEMFLKNIPVTGTWVFLKDNYENIVGYSNGLNIILISKNGGLDFETKTMPTIIKSGCYDIKNETYKLLGVQKVFESEDLINWTPYNTDNTNWDYIGIEVKFTGTTFLSSSANRRWKECSTSTYTGTYRTYTKTPKSIARINNTTAMMIVNTDNTQMYTASINTHNLPTQLNANINKIINLNDVVYALCNNSNKLYEYVMSVSAVTGEDYWQEYTLPITCTAEDIAYNSLDGYYYIVNDSNNYIKTKDFENFEIVNKNTTRGKYCIRTKEGLIISPNNSNQLLFAPAREKLENRLQQLKMDLDKTRWAGNGLEVVGEQIQVKGSYNIQVTNGGIYVNDNLDLYNFNSEIRLLLRTRLADVLDYPIEATQEYLDEWIWSEDVLWEKLFDGVIQALQVRWSVGGTFYEPYGYMEEYTVEKYERGCFYVDQDDMNLKYIKIGVEPPIE